jgi:hypothetical protein
MWIGSRLLAVLLLLWPALAWAVSMHDGIGSRIGRDGLHRPGGPAGVALPPYTSGPADVVSGASAWFGLRAYSAAIAAAGTQKSINVRNTGTNETCDVLIATTGGLKSTVANCSGASTGAAVPTFCGSGCTVTKLYDQTGNGRDISQATAASQPALTLSCIGSLPCLSFAGSQVLGGSLIAPIPQPFSLSQIVKHTGAAESWNFNTYNGGGAGFLSSHNGANLGRVYCGANVTVTVTDNVRHAMSGVCNGNSSLANIDGTITTALAAGTSATTAAIGYGAQFNIFSNPLAGDMDEAGVWPFAFTPANTTSLCLNQQSYWGSSNFGAVCTVPLYTGLGDLAPATAWYGLRAYSGAIAAAGTPENPASSQHCLGRDLRRSPGHGWQARQPHGLFRLLRRRDPGDLLRVRLHHLDAVRPSRR